MDNKITCFYCGKLKNCWVIVRKENCCGLCFGIIEKFTNTHENNFKEIPIGTNLNVKEDWKTENWRILK